MSNQPGFILKVFILSAVLSALIKYVCPALPVAANNTIALIAIFLPSLVLAVALFLQSRKNQSL